MTVLTQDESRLTERYQTTVPSSVRKQLNLGKGDRLRYCLETNGRVYIEPVRDEARDPALVPFLDFLQNDIQTRPDRLRPLDAGLIGRIETLVDGVEVDLDAELSPDDD